MATTKIDTLILGRAGLTDNSQAAVIFSANNAVAYWSNLTTYAQYNVVEYGGAVYRSKIASNLNNQPNLSASSWERLYNGTKDGDFAFVIGSGATILQREGGVWVVFGNHPAEAVFYDEHIDYVASSPGAGQAIGPVATSTIITLPVNSRKGNTQESYIVGSGDLQILINGDHTSVGDDWLEVGSPSSSSTQIQINRPLAIGWRITFRKTEFLNITGYGGSGGGGGGSLQAAYLVGNAITTNSGVPFTVNGPSGQKIAQFNGDIGVSGLLDPSGLTFSRQGSDPLGSNDGLWVNSSGELIYKQNGVSSTNITQVLAGNLQSSSVMTTGKNMTGSTLPYLAPVSLDSVTGYLKVTDPTVENDVETFQGVLVQSIPNGGTGFVLQSGILPNVTTSLNAGQPVWVGMLGTLTNIKPDYGINGFGAGDFVLKVGAIATNISNPTQKDLIVNSSVRGLL